MLTYVHVNCFLLLIPDHLPPDTLPPAVGPVDELVAGVVRDRQYIAEYVVAADHHVVAVVGGPDALLHDADAVRDQDELVGLCGSAAVRKCVKNYFVLGSTRWLNVLNFKLH